jgi:DnaK suppressor protein
MLVEFTDGVRREPMDENRARTLLQDERAEVLSLLAGTEAAQQADQEAQAEVGDAADPAQPLAAEAQDESIAQTLRDRLAAIDRALQRLDEGTYGRSVRSGVPIPDERLEADPAAELTVEEARAEAG